jgi:predicted dehydrogenase
MPRPDSLSRRSFFFGTAAATAALAGSAAFTGCASSPRRTTRRVSPNEKLNLASIGVAGRGGEDLKGVSSENIVALCDIDSLKLAAAGEKYPKAARYDDFRRLLDRNDIDGVTIGTPDHTHAVMVVAALQSGRHVYCEKPLTHTISEARRVAEVTRESGLITQMGNQIHSGGNYRRVVEMIQSGAIGDVREVHHWVDGTWDVRKRPEPDPIPAHINWPLWLGPVPFRDYSDQYVPFNWRRWWVFGGGTLSDFCCHHIDLSLWSLQLGLPTRIEAEGPQPPDVECAPPWLVVRYEFPARKAVNWGGTGRSVELPPVKLTWHQGGKRPPQFAAGLLPKWGDGSLFVGSKGMLLADYGRLRLFPEKDFANHAAPARWIDDSPGQHEEWIRAIKGGPAPLCHFGYGARLTEIGLLGNLAYRVGKPLDWDARRMRATNAPEADRLIRHEYAPGWRI